MHNEAADRALRCQENTIGVVRCSDARADQAAVDRLLNQWEEFDNKKAQTEADQAAEQKAREVQQLETAKELSEAKKADDVKAELELRRAEQSERRRRENVELVRLMTPESRWLFLQVCDSEHAREGCDPLLQCILEVTTDEVEKRRFVEAHTAYIAGDRNVYVRRLEANLRKPNGARPAPRGGSTGTPQKQEKAEPEPRSVKCCDGSLSPSCMCGGSMRGCCSHHHGVCGCE